MVCSTWTKERIPATERDQYLSSGRDFIDDAAIRSALEAAQKPSNERIRGILQKSLAIKTLGLDECAALLNADDPEIVAEMEQAALTVKKKVYDNRIVTFAPLYMSSKCVNNCSYCSFRSGNTRAENRSVLSREQIVEEIRTLAGKIGHKRLIVVYGEHPDSDADYIAQSIGTIYGVREKTRNGWAQIRRVNVNAAPMTIDGLKILKAAKIGTYQVFQETYDRAVYDTVHPHGTVKNDYRWRLYSMHRAMEAGIDDVGIGALFGLADWRFEVMGLLSHARELEQRFGVGPHTISFPRLVNAENAPASAPGENAVSDADLRRVVTVLRLAVPSTGMILTARENAEMRRSLIPLGVTQTDASSRIGLGAYSKPENFQRARRQQFVLNDTRSLDDVVRQLAEMGYITSFCTAGYRCGRTGKKIMEYLRNGKECVLCKLNAVITFREWLDDFASDATRRVGEKIITGEIAGIKEIIPESFFRQFMESYDKTSQGTRDIYF